MDLQTALTHLKNGEIAPVYLLTGEENYLIKRFESQVLTSYLGEQTDAMHYLSFDMETVEIQEAITEANTISFFNERRVIIIRHPYFLTGVTKKNRLTHDLEQLMAYVEQPAEDVVLVIIADYEKLDQRKKVVKQLKKHATLVDVQEMKEAQVHDYIQRLVKEASISMDRQVLDAFLKRTNYQLTRAVEEMEKLVLFVGEIKTIRMSDVDALVSQTLDDNIFNLTDFVMQKDSEKALKLYRELVAQKQHPMVILALLQSNFRLYTQIAQFEASGYDQGSIAKAIGAHPYRVKMATQQMRRYPISRLMMGYMALVTLEDDIKTGKSEEHLGIEWFILQFCAS